MPAEPAPVQQINVLENVETPSYEDKWVTVFGFAVESSTISAVLQEFQACGNILMWVHPPAATCNWIYVQFEDEHGAQRALQRNGSRLGLLHILVGVQPPSHQDKHFITSQNKQAFESQGMAPALPQRQYGLAPTRAKVCVMREWLGRNLQCGCVLALRFYRCANVWGHAVTS